MICTNTDHHVNTLSTIKKEKKKKKKLEKQICRTVGPSSLAASLEPLAHRENVVSLTGLAQSAELAQLALLPYSQGRSTCYSDRFHDFSAIIPTPDVTRMSCQQFLSSHS